jgi:hypothetical protein
VRESAHQTRLRDFGAARACTLTRVGQRGRVEDMQSVLFSGSDDESAQDAMGAWRRRMPPDNEVAGTVAVDTVLTRSADVAFTLRSVQVLSNGGLLSFVLQHRVDDDPAAIGPQRFAFDRDVLVGVGDLIVVAASVTHDLPEGRVVVSGDAIAAAAGRGQVLWPREPDRQYQPEDARLPDVPPGGWFARVLGVG